MIRKINQRSVKRLLLEFGKFQKYNHNTMSIVNKRKNRCDFNLQSRNLIHQLLPCIETNRVKKKINLLEK